MMLSNVKFYVYCKAFLWQLPVVETFCAVFICFLPRANHNLTVHFLICLYEHEDMFTVVNNNHEQKILDPRFWDALALASTTARSEGV